MVRKSTPPEERVRKMAPSLDKCPMAASAQEQTKREERKLLNREAVKLRCQQGRLLE
jgi:hypothetical protein